MVTKKNTKKIPANKKHFVVQFHSSIIDPDLSYDIPVFYSETGHGWDTIGSATKYSESGADKLILELLKEDKIVALPMDVNVKPENRFSINTAFLNNMNIPQIITKVPQYHGDTYYLLPSAENIEEQDLMDMLRDDEFMILWDSDRSVVPESNWEFLKAHGCVE
jgi:hypothetical protein